MPSTGTEVTAHVEGYLSLPTELVCSVAVAAGPQVAEEQFTASVSGAAATVIGFETAHRSRLHKIIAPAGQLVVDYRAVVSGTGPQQPYDLGMDTTFRRPSRYCESDKLALIARKQFGHLAGQDLVNGVADWVHDNVFYVPGSSGVTDGALDTLLAQQGVCRDFAHLTIALLRGCGLPARLASVYAPGLRRMDFHAVAEVALDGVWQVVDSTRLAPRASMVRIATGRDAADTAFMTVHSGSFRLSSVYVTAYRHEGLPTEQPHDVVSL